VSQLGRFFGIFAAGAPHLPPFAKPAETEVFCRPFVTTDPPANGSAGHSQAKNAQSAVATGARYWIEYRGNTVDLGRGQISVGRSAMCGLVLDDPLVSRQHAEFRIENSRVVVYDLKSVNGVFVNGSRVDHKMSLSTGDRITIGDQAMVLIIRTADSETTPEIPSRRRGVDTLQRTDDKREAFREPPVTAAASLQQDATPQAPAAQAMELFGGLAEKAFALGRGEEAERLLAPRLKNVLAAVRAKVDVPAASSELAANHAVRLASVTNKGEWIDYAFELYRALERPLPAAVVDQLYEVLRHVQGVNLGDLREYLAVLHAAQARFGPADRFLVQRIAGLERLAALR